MIAQPVYGRNDINVGVDEAASAIGEESYRWRDVLMSDFGRVDQYWFTAFPPHTYVDYVDVQHTT